MSKHASARVTMHKKTEMDYHLVGKPRGIVWAGKTQPKNTNTPTQWRCAHGHVWTARYKNIQLGRGCPTCGTVSRKTGEHYEAAATARGWQWIGPLPPTVNAKTLWICEQDHLFRATYKAVVVVGFLCPYCQKDDKAERYHSIGKPFGLHWVGALPVSVHKPTTWRCSNGHKWDASYVQIRSGRPCPCCLTEMYRALAEEKNIVWADDQSPPPHKQRKTWWQCPFGHKWLASYEQIATNSQCPWCQP